MLIKLSVIVLLLFLVGCTPEKGSPDPVAEAPENVEKTVAVSSPAKAAAKPAARSSAVRPTKDIKELEEALKAGVPVVVKLGSDSCYPCRMMNPVIAELAVELDGKAVFLNLDVYKHRELAGEAQVRVIPTILFYDKYGKPKAKHEGGMSKEQLLNTIEEMELNK